MTAFFEKSYKNTRTIKTPDFDKKSGAFLTFLGFFWTLKLAWGYFGVHAKIPFFEDAKIRTFLKIFLRLCGLEYSLAEYTDF